MAARNSFRASLGTLMDCSICFNPYDNTQHVPFVFGCQHTVCGVCLAELLEVHDAKPDFPCPICRETIVVKKGGVECYTKSILLLELLQTQEPQDAELADDPKQMICPKHATKQITHVCTTCKEGLCCKCVVSLASGDHSGHELEDLEDAYARMDKLASVYQQFLDDFVPLHQRCKVNEQKLQALAQEAKKEVAKMAQEAIAYVQREQRKLETEIDGLCKSVVEDEQCTDSDDEIDIVSHLKEVINQLQNKDISAIKSTEELEELESDTDLIGLKEKLAVYETKLLKKSFKVISGNIRFRTFGFVRLCDESEYSTVDSLSPLKKF